MDRRADRDDIIPPHFDERVTILYYYPNMDPDLIDACVDRGYRGIVIAGTGRFRIVSEAPQPIVVSNRLQDVPKTGLWAWDPGAHFGVHRMDEFFFTDAGTN